MVSVNDAVSVNEDSKPADSNAVMVSVNDAVSVNEDSKPADSNAVMVSVKDAVSVNEDSIEPDSSVAMLSVNDAVSVKDDSIEPDSNAVMVSVKVAVSDRGVADRGPDANTNTAPATLTAIKRNKNMGVLLFQFIFYTSTAFYSIPLLPSIMILLFSMLFVCCYIRCQHLHFQT